jgi:hypothetical protein
MGPGEYGAAGTEPWYVRVYDYRSARWFNKIMIRSRCEVC